jgi:hypothetical protein
MPPLPLGDPANLCSRLCGGCRDPQQTYKKLI